MILHTPKARIKEVTNERNAVRHYMYYRYYVVLVVSVEAYCDGVWSIERAGSRLVERVGRNARNRGSKPTTIFVGFMVSVHL